MAPTDWVVLEHLREWLETMDPSKYSEIIGVEESFWRPSNNQEEVLLQTVAEILNKSASMVNFKSSFIASGGDSISAMQLTARCALKGYRLMVCDVLQTSSLLALASKMVQTTKTSQVEQCEEIVDKQFNFHPIPKMHFESIPSGANHVNQSYLLKLTREFSDANIEHALRDIVKEHGKLRSRFIRHQDEWFKFASSSTKNCLDFRTVSAGSFESVCDIATVRHKDTDITSGPLFIVTSISTPGGKFLSMICQHLAIDLYSWRIIINDLQELLLGRTLQPASTPFSAWTRLQERHIRGEGMTGIPGHRVDLDYWGMKKEDNLFADMEEVITALPQNVTPDLLSLASATLNCEIADMLLASITRLLSKNFLTAHRPRFSVNNMAVMFGTVVSISPEL
ncbi:putative NRPS-like protein biosynthetic cluster [Metarhizium acridum]|uniref:putative NRPS-like protein biosynthetic cluster n=1 Tax=Metarhizium acridum TaxID=92637 RepID=UPI001C6BAD96|nr:putative NRPS-like protein biosynthetic cluster [Metarhizium acridum]KAG8416155.1 putative NRPS-like protein biosynthetic cluster [Metarhizium acridum]